MIYKRFYLNIIIRIVLLFITSFWLSVAIQTPEKLYTLITAIILSIAQIIFLINYINKTNHDLTRFFASLKDKSSSSHFKLDDKKGNYKDLAITLNEVSELIATSRIETEKQTRYFDFVFEHIPVGLVTLDNHNNIIFTNKALKDLLLTDVYGSLDKLNSVYPELVKEIKLIKPGENKVQRVKINKRFSQILIRSVNIKFENEILKIITIQDIKKELEENELLSWQKLIRVLTHEIMNSITPISNLTLAINKCLTNSSEINLKSEVIQDVLTNNKLIEERSIGLRSFVEKYRSLTQIKTLNISEFSINDLFSKTLMLFEDCISEKNIKIEVEVKPGNLLLEADEKLLEQVLINLIKNAIESVDLSTNKSISLKAYKNFEDKTEIQIIDSGVGIPDDIIDHIFMPFYTTKEQGSGIGLSLARQIMRLHGGTISVDSTPQKVTTFTLTF